MTQSSITPPGLIPEPHTCSSENVRGNGGAAWPARCSTRVLPTTAAPPCGDRARLLRPRVSRTHPAATAHPPCSLETSGSHPCSPWVFAPVRRHRSRRGRRTGGIRSATRRTNIEIAPRYPGREEQPDREVRPPPPCRSADIWTHRRLPDARRTHARTRP